MQPLSAPPFSFVVEVFADGPTKVFRIADVASTLVPQNTNLPDQDKTQIDVVVRATLSSIGLSVIDTTPQVLHF